MIGYALSRLRGRDLHVDAVVPGIVEVESVHDAPGRNRGTCWLWPRRCDGHGADGVVENGVQLRVLAAFRMLVATPVSLWAKQEPGRSCGPETGV
jgi:hypothetical protein